MILFKMKIKDISFVFCFLFGTVISFAQVKTNSIDSSDFENEEVTDTIQYKNTVYYSERLINFFDALNKLGKEETNKVNIVHIGDSHIQADFFSGKVRTLMQERFGNGGLGFTFPYQLAKTNSNNLLRYSSNMVWENRRNIYPVNGANVGLSGIALSSKEKKGIIKVDLKDNRYSFNKVKIFTPTNEVLYKVGITDKDIELTTKQSKEIVHKIKSGESLSSIAKKYGTTISMLKKNNKLKTDNIRAGNNLVVGTTVTERPVVLEKIFSPTHYEVKDKFVEYQLPNDGNGFYLYTVGDVAEYDLNGLVVENNEPGIIYHSIGVNGAKFSDYNKYPLFFDQLTGLSPDLVIISMGTNESFDRLDDEVFKQEINLFIKSIKSNNPNTAILLTTPPPSYFAKGKPNNYATALSNAISVNAVNQKYAIWDLYNNLGGTLGLPYLLNENLLAKDLVHYTIKGYEYTGTLFYEGLMKVYDEYLKNETK